MSGTARPPEDLCSGAVVSLLCRSGAIRWHDGARTSAKGGARSSHAYTESIAPRHAAVAEPRQAAKEGPGARSRALGARPSGPRPRSGRRAPEEPRPFGPPLAQDDRWRLERRFPSPQAAAAGGRVGHGVDEGDGVAFVARAARWRSPWWRSRRGGRRIAGRSRRRSSRPPAGRSFAAFRPPQGGRRFHGLCRAHESRRRRFSGCDSRPNRGGTDLVIVPTKMRERSAARGPAPARPLHFRESRFSLPSRSMLPGVPGRRGTPPRRQVRPDTRWSPADACIRPAAGAWPGGREAAGVPRRHRVACRAGSAAVPERPTARRTSTMFRPIRSHRRR